MRAAFQRANDELDRRILEIDPSLKPFVEQRRGLKKRWSSQRNSPRRQHTSSPKVTPLTSVARPYGVSVDTLIQVNHLSKQTPLQVAQKAPLFPPTVSWRVP